MRTLSGAPGSILPADVLSLPVQSFSAHRRLLGPFTLHSRPQERGGVGWRGGQHTLFNFGSQRNELVLKDIKLI